MKNFLSTPVAISPSFLANCSSQKQALLLSFSILFFRHFACDPRIIFLYFDHQKSPTKNKSKVTKKSVWSTKNGERFFVLFRPIWVRKARACLAYPNGYTRHRLIFKPFTSAIAWHSKYNRPSYHFYQRKFPLQPFSFRK